MIAETVINIICLFIRDGCIGCPGRNQIKSDDSERKNHCIMRQ